MMTKLSTLAIFLCVSGVASAHVMLDQPAVLAGQSYRAVFVVGHGCAGAPTTGLRVRIPAGFRNAKPLPKPGWNIALDAAAGEIAWSAAGQGLPDAWADEFVLRGEAPRQAGALWFKILQTCGGTSVDWAEIPASGTATRGLKSPAALLEVIPSEAAAEHVH